MKRCERCGGKQFETVAEADEFSRLIEADEAFDSGEFSGSHNYYEGFCECPDDSDGSGTGEGHRAEAQVAKDKGDGR